MHRSSTRSRGRDNAYMLGPRAHGWCALASGRYQWPPAVRAHWAHCRQPTGSVALWKWVFVTTLCFKFVFVFVFCCVQKCTWSFNFVFRLHSSSDSKSTILKPCHAIHDSTRCEIIDSSTGPAGSASLSLVEIISNLILEFLSAPYIAAFAASLASK